MNIATLLAHIEKLGAGPPRLLSVDSGEGAAPLGATVFA